MTHQPPVLSRYLVSLFGGYLLLFLVLHSPAAEPTPGILAGQLENYLGTTAALNPLQWLHARLGAYQFTAVRVELALILGWLFMIYLRTVRHLQTTQPEVRLRQILLSILLWSVPLILLPHLLSRDVFGYILRGRLSAVYRVNPAVVAPAVFPLDPFYPWARWRDEPSVYGPVWMLASQGLTTAVEYLGGWPWLYVGGYKLLALGSHLLSTALLWRLLGRWKPRQQAWGTVLYGWSPLALIEFAGSAHNDALMICLLLLGVLLAYHGRWRWAVVALAAATLVKWVPGLVLGLYVVMLARQRRGWSSRVMLMAQAGAIVLGTVLLVYAPYRQGAQALSTAILTPVSKQASPVNTVYALVEQGAPPVARRLVPGWSTAQAQDLATVWLGWLSRGLLLLIVGAGAATVWQKATFERFVASSRAVLLLTLLLATPHFWPWYATWPLALAATAPWGPIGQTSVAFSAAVVVIYITIGSPGDWLPQAVTGLRPLYVFPPVLGLLAAGLWQARRGRAQGYNAPVADAAGAPRI